MTGRTGSDQVIAFTQICHVVALDTPIALAAAEAARAHKLATADAIVFATSQSKGARLLTCDGHFKGLPGVTLIEKGKH
ncbi:MAG: PIN domain-containing protein [Rubrivivax sp.]